MRSRRSPLLRALALGFTAALLVASCSSDDDNSSEGSSSASTGACDFGEIFTTDGRIEELNIELVEDPGVFILYNASYTWNNEHYEANAETYDEIASTIFEGLDNETMTGLNFEVDIEGRPAEEVAQEYVEEIGLTGGDALDGVSVRIGSKDFTENILLGEMLAEALANEGADVDNQINLGGTQVNREALLSGDIDVYPDYNGTGWTEHLGQEDPSSDPEELFTMVAEMDLEENDIAWVGRSPFNDTYGFVANGDLAEAEGGFDLQSMADYLEANPDATLCLESEFPDRSDGLVLFEEATGYEVPEDQITILDTGAIYTETAG